MLHAMSENRNVTGHCLVVAQADQTCLSVLRVDPACQGSVKRL